MKLLSRLHETRVVRRLRAMFCALCLLAIFTPTVAQTTVLNGYVYKKVTSTTELNTVAYDFILVCEATNSVMTGISNSKDQMESCTLSDGILTGYDTEPFVFTLTNKSSYYYIKSSSGQYLKAATSGTNLSLASTSKDCELAIKFEANGDVKIGYYKSNKYISLNNGVLGHNGTYGTDSYKAVQLYRREYVVSFPKATQGLTTFYNADYGYELPSGVTAYAVSCADENQPIGMTKAFNTGAYIKSNTALLLKGTPGETLYIPTRNNAAGVFSGTNLLEGGRTADGYTAASKAGDYYYYKLAIKDGQLGFYWGAEKGAAFQMTKPTTAYLAVPKSAVQQAAGLRIDLDAITGVKCLEMQGGKDLNDGDGQIYTLDGRRCTTVPRKGMYIINGKKVIR
ncbi:MAG: hypothetical protein MR624_04560 [Bacteroidales bacterium]|nr:hypothetical protein [Bacteroidales bacterium]